MRVARLKALVLQSRRHCQRPSRSCESGRSVGLLGFSKAWRWREPAFPESVLCMAVSVSVLDLAGGPRLFQLSAAVTSASDAMLSKEGSAPV